MVAFDVGLPRQRRRSEQRVGFGHRRDCGADTGARERCEEARARTTQPASLSTRCFSRCFSTIETPRLSGAPAPPRVNRACSGSISNALTGFSICSTIIRYFSENYARWHCTYVIYDVHGRRARRVAVRAALLFSWRPVQFPRGQRCSGHRLKRRS